MKLNRLSVDAETWRESRAVRGMTSAIRWWVYAAGACLVGTLALLTHARGEARVVVPTASLELGELSPDQQHVVRLPISNPTLRTVRIVAIHSSCGCTKIRPTKLDLGPWSRTELELTLDLADRAALAAEEAESRGVPAEAAPFEVTLTPEIDDSDLGAIQWTLRGRVVPAAATAL